MARKPGSRPRGYVTVTPAKAISPVRPPVGTYPGGLFPPVGGAALSTVIESNVVTLAGLLGTTALTIVGGQYSKNGAAYSSAATTVTNGDTLRLRVTSSASAGTATSAVATIDGVARTFTVATAAATPAPTPTPVPTPTPTPAGDLTVNTLRRVSLPTNPLNVPAPTQDANTPAVSTLSAPSARAIVLNPTDLGTTWEGVGFQIQHAMEYNMTTLLTPTQADAFMDGLMAGGRTARGRFYAGDGVFIAKYKPDGVTADYTTPLGPVSDLTQYDVSLPSDQFLNGLNFANQEERVGKPLDRCYARNPKFTTFMTVATYPARMKTGFNNGSILDDKGYSAAGCGGTIRSDALHHAVRMVCETLAWKADRGTPVKVVGLQNEPEVEGGKRYPTTLWAAGQMASGIKLLGPMLREPQYNTGKRKLAETEILLGECNSNAAGAMIRAVLADPEAAQWVDRIGLHLYNLGLDVAASIRAMKPTLKFDMTEWRTLVDAGYGDPNSGNQTVGDAHSKMWQNAVFEVVRNDFSSTTLFVPLLTEHGEPTTNNRNRRGIAWAMSDGSGYKPQPEYHLIGEVARGVDVGARRMFCGDIKRLTTVDAVAFRNLDGRTAVLLQNTTRSATRTVDLVCAITGKITTITLAAGQVSVTNLTQPAATGAVVGAPSALTAVGSETQVALSWTNPGGSLGTRILRKTGTGAYEQVTVCEAGRTTFTDTTTTTGTAYTYMAQAIGNGLSTNNPTINATTSGTALPPAPDITMAFSNEPEAGKDTVITISGRYDANTDERIEIADGAELVVGANNQTTWRPGSGGATAVQPVTRDPRLANTPYRSPAVYPVVKEANSTPTPTPTPTPQPFLSATFTAPAGTVLTGVTDANGTVTQQPYQPEVGGPFIKNTQGAPSDFIISGSGTLYTGGNTARAGITPPVQNYRASFTAYRFGTGVGTVGIMARAATDSDSGYTLTYNNSTSVWALQRRVNGSGTTLLSSPATDHPITTGNSMTAELILNGSSLTMIVDGATIGTVTDTARSDGNLAVRYLTQIATGSAAHVTSMSAAPLA